MSTGNVLVYSAIMFRIENSSDNENNLITKRKKKDKKLHLIESKKSISIY